MFDFTMWIQGNIYNLCDDVFSEKVDIARYDNDVFTDMMSLVMESDKTLTESDFRFDIDFCMNPIDEETAENILFVIDELEDEIYISMNNYKIISDTIDSHYTACATVEFFDKEFAIIEKRYQNLTAFYNAINEYNKMVIEYFQNRFGW